MFNFKLNSVDCPLYNSFFVFQFCSCVVSKIEIKMKLNEINEIIVMLKKLS